MKAMLDLVFEQLDAVFGALFSPLLTAFHRFQPAIQFGEALPHLLAQMLDFLLRVLGRERDLLVEAFDLGAEFRSQSIEAGLEAFVRLLERNLQAFEQLVVSDLDSFEQLLVDAHRRVIVEPGCADDGYNQHYHAYNYGDHFGFHNVRHISTGAYAIKFGRITMGSTSDARTPNEQLAEIVANALVNAGLISSARLEDLKRKLAAGTAKAEDWSHWIESAQRSSQRKERGGDE